MAAWWGLPGEAFVSTVSINDIAIDPAFGALWRNLLQAYLAKHPNPSGGPWLEADLPDETGHIQGDGSLMLYIELPEPLVGPSMHVPAEHWMFTGSVADRES